MGIERALCPVLIGRDAELSALEDALRAARRGEGRPALLVGDAGIGKSRLAHELERRAEDERIRTLWGGCTPADLAVPYLPFVEAIGTYLDQADLGWLRTRLGRSRLALAPLFPQLDPDQEAPTVGSAAERKLRLFEGILALMQAAAGTRGLLLVLEDIHWADASTSELLGYLARRLRGTRMMVLATCRGEELTPGHRVSSLSREWRNFYQSILIALGPLSKDALGEMLRTILAGQPLPEALRDLLNSRSDGNPFVLEELVRDALDRGFLDGDGKPHWETLTNFTLPKTVRDTLLARLDRLPRKFIEVAKNAAVIGSTFDYWTLVSASGLNQETVERGLEACVEHQLMKEERSGPVRYRFRHALTHEAIYDSIPGPSRQRIHLRAAQALRAAPTTQAADLAYHLFAAGNWQEAVPVSLIAAQEAERRLGYREAIALYTGALAHINDRLTRGQTLCKLGRAYVYADDPGRAWPYLKEGIPLIEEAGLIREAAAFRFWLGRCYWERYRPDLARVEYERVRAMLEGEGPSEVLANANALLGALEFFQLRFSTALSLATRAVEIAEAANAAVPAIWGRFYIGAAQAGLGDVAEGLNNLARAYDDAIVGGLIWLAVNAAFHSSVVLSTSLRAREAQDWISRLNQLPQTAYRDRLGTFGESVRLYELGDLQRFFPAIENALQLATEADATVWIIRSRMFKAMGLAASGAYEQAVAVMPHDDDIHERLEHNWALAFKIRMFLERGALHRAAMEARRVLLEDYQPSDMVLRLFDVAAEALAGAGNVDEAGQLLARAQQARNRDHPYLLRMEASVALARGELPKAERLLRHSVDRMNLMGHALDESRTRRLLARVLAGRGDRVGAGSELRQVINYAARSGASLEGALAKELLTELELPLTKDAQSPEPARGAPLSPREKDVAVLIAQGLTNKQIARRLQIAERTAENHVEHILNRLGFQARAQVAAWVAQERLV